MSKKTTKQLFVEVLNSGYIVTEDNKKNAFESVHSLKNHLQQKFEFINVVIDKATTENFGLEITLEENVNVKMEQYMDKKWSEIKKLQS